jgi:hypothetical protein
MTHLLVFSLLLVIAGARIPSRLLVPPPIIGVKSQGMPNSGPSWADYGGITSIGLGGLAGAYYSGKHAAKTGGFTPSTVILMTAALVVGTFTSRLVATLNYSTDNDAVDTVVNVKPKDGFVLRIHSTDLIWASLIPTVAYVVLTIFDTYGGGAKQ